MAYFFPGVVAAWGIRHHLEQASFIPPAANRALTRLALKFFLVSS
jgi:hypothetical protein